MVEHICKLENKYLNNWQKLCFDYEGENPSQKADSLRGMLAELEHFSYPSSSNVDDQLSASAVEIIASDIHGRLSTVVDAFDSNTGLNNYAEQSLSYVKHQVNESQKWQCRLRLNPQFLNDHDVGESDASHDQTLAEDLSCFISNYARGFDELVAEERSNDTEFSRKSEMKTHWSHNTGNITSRQTSTHHSNNDSAMRRFASCNGSNRHTERNSNIARNRGSNSEFSESPALIDYEKHQIPVFRTAKDQLIIEKKKKVVSNEENLNSLSVSAYGSVKKSLGARLGTNQKFVPPVMRNSDKEHESRSVKRSDDEEQDVQDERLKNISPKMIELIESEIMDCGPPVQWNDIAGLEFAKNTIKEIVVWPMLRPDLFTGLRGPPKGLLLFGPPGTGKTLIGKCVASQSKATFFNISASSLTSKWIGDGEKMVRALFAVARTHLPAVIFIDEIDSILTQRSESEHESSRRLKTEFLIQLDGATTCSDEQLLIIGATNRPQELDEAARRRLVKRLYIPLPEACARRQIVKKLLMTQVHCTSEDDLQTICDMTDGYSGADMTNLCKEASLGPIRSLGSNDIQTISLADVRAIDVNDFKQAAKQVRASVSQKDLNLYLEWNDNFGSLSTV